MTTATNFLGMPVSGEITQGSARTEQKPIEELAPLFQALLDDPTIVEFGWSQYTPYFNDGEVCEFSVHYLWVRTTAEADGVADKYGEPYVPGYELDVNYHPSLGKVKYDYNKEGHYVPVAYEGPDEDRYNRCQDLSRALQSGAFDNVLLEHFGDHAMVTVRNDGIEVEFYSHD
jgi:hypothetical protein